MKPARKPYTMPTLSGPFDTERDWLIEAIVQADDEAWRHRMDAMKARRTAELYRLVAVCSVCLAGVFLVLWLT